MVHCYENIALKLGHDDAGTCSFSVCSDVITSVHSSTVDLFRDLCVLARSSHRIVWTERRLGSVLRSIAWTTANGYGRHCATSILTITNEIQRSNACLHIMLNGMNCVSLMSSAKLCCLFDNITAVKHAWLRKSPNRILEWWRRACYPYLRNFVVTHQSPYTRLIHFYTMFKIYQFQFWRGSAHDIAERAHSAVAASWLADFRGGENEDDCGIEKDGKRGNGKRKDRRKGWGYPSVLARSAFARTNRRVIAMMFVRLSGTGVHCDHTVQANADLSLWLYSSMLWAPRHQSMSTYSQPSFFPVLPGREVWYG